MDLEDMGFAGSAWVAPMRRILDRLSIETTLSAR